MWRRTSVLRWAIVLAIATACGSTPTISTYRDAPVILISIDTLRADRLPIYGYRNGTTPELDKLAGHAIVFEDLYSHAPLTLPSHASLMTGRLPMHHGVRDNLGYALASDAATLASRFKSAGYTTGAAVSSFVLRRQTGISAGFDFFDDRIEVAGSGDSLSDTRRDGRLTVDALAAWIDRQASPKLFAFLHLYEPHAPYPAPPSHQRGNAYDSAVSYADELVGRLLARVAARQWLDRAIVVVVSDHGEGLGDHGESEHGIFLYREALHVPGFVRLPGGAGAGRRVSGTLGLVDLTATLLDLAGLDASGLDGRSARSAMTGTEPLARDVYSESMYPRLHLGWSELTAATRQQLRYIRAPRPELYDLASDANERKNLASVRASTASELDAWLSRTAAGAATLEPQPVSAEVSQRLKSLGYVGSAGVPLSAPGASLPDPKDGIASFEAFKKALVEEHNGRIDEAIQIYRSLLASNPRMEDAWEALGRALLIKGRTTDAIAAFRSASEIDPLKPEPHLALARIYGLERQPVLARQHAEIASQRDPAQAFEILAELMMDAGKFDEAAGYASKSLGADPARYMSEYLLGVVAQARAKCEEAIPHFQRAIEGKLLEPHAVVKNLHAGLADCLARTGRFAEAEHEFKAELAVIPDSTEARNGLVALYRSQGRDIDARKVLQGK